MKRKFDILCIGNAAMDAFVEIPKSCLKENNVCIQAGTKIETKNLSLYSGGGATNTAVGFSRRKLKTAILASIGKDYFGKEIKQELQKEKVNVDYLFETPNYKTAFSVILTGFGDRIILVYGGATRHLTEKHAIKFSALQQANWLYLGSIHSEKGTIKRIVAEAKKAKTKIAFNPGNTEIKKKLKGINGINVLFLNEEEAATVTGKKSIKQKLEELSKIAKLVVITKGKRGAEAFDGSRYHSIKSKKVKVVDTTGAGDAFNSGFLTEIIKGKNIRAALNAGIENSCSVIQYLGAKNRLLKGD
jgi:sugar/nucleoside kinase (ribokinase family)